MSSYTQIHSNYEPALFCVMEYHEGGMAILDAVAAVQADKGNDGWTDWLRRVPGPIADLAKKDREKKDASDPSKDVPPRDEAVKQRFLAKLLDPALAEAVRAAAIRPAVTAAEDTAMEEAEATTMPVIPLVEGATRYLALDPSLCCGWAVIHVKAEQLVSVSVGAIQIDSSATNVGSRCNDLKRQIQPLLSPPPALVFLESFVGHSKPTDEISYALRAAIKMELNPPNPLIPFEEAMPQTWKSAIGVAGNEKDKGAVKAALERTFGASFPDKIPGGRSMVKFKDDASDAAGIGVWGIRQHHPSLSFATPVEICAPAIAARSDGKRTASSGDGGKKARWK